MTYLKNNIKFIIFLLVFGLVGGYFTTLYSIESMPPETVNEAVAQVGSLEVVVWISAVQTALLYSLVLGILGKILSEKIGLWKKFTIEVKPIISVVFVSVVGGMLLILLDFGFFGNFSQVIKDSYTVKPTVNFIISCKCFSPNSMGTMSAYRVIRNTRLLFRAVGCFS